jgi:hypothetical protein
VAAFNIVFIIATKGYYMWRNNTRETNWNAMTAEERATYLKTFTDKGNKRYVSGFENVVVSNTVQTRLPLRTLDIVRQVVLDGGDTPPGKKLLDDFDAGTMLDRGIE